ncbi:MAG TPA: hypothetical protein PLT00_13165 [Verrucomicrobiota bacterium]|jgi:hypothetical protein|nr:MAG: hypothetical protein BWX84_00669 [Verrucomicrobia bacterium ADurb.Bin118]HPY31263.1 hypothetical protein [Verrucomicrobiota bacterium]HQB17651.1 hypothetical protein [Verrucomicrobiota bacterium]
MLRSLNLRRKPLVLFRRSTWSFAPLSALCLIFGLAVLVGCTTSAARSSDDILICKQFYAEAMMRKEELNHTTFQPRDLTFGQLRILTPRDPEWRKASFWALNCEWGHPHDAKRIVIFCDQSRLNARGERVHCAGDNTGVVTWLTEAEISQLPWQDFVVLPKIRP